MKQGFSLVEMAVVIVVIGLIVGGVVTGATLIRNAEVGSIVSDYHKIESAFAAFEQKYGGKPGDIDDATAYWGDNSTHCADAGITDGDPGTCNGNADGILTMEAAAAGEESEGFMFWNQLYLAGMIDGKYTGIAGAASTSQALPGENVMVSDVDDACFAIEEFAAGGSGQRYDIDYGDNQIELGVVGTGSECDDPFLTPSEAMSVDKKIDDGKPGRGNVIARYWDDACATASANTDVDAGYKLSDDTIQCSLIFRGGWLE